MSTTALLRPPLEAVFTPRDAEQVADALFIKDEKLRWARFLVARRALLAALRGIRDRGLELLERLHLGSALRAAQTTVGWLVGGWRLLQRGVEVVGIASAIGWVIASPTVRNAAYSALGMARQAVSAVGRALGRAGRWVLGLFGAPGRAAAARVADLGRQAVARVREVVMPILKPVVTTAVRLLDVHAPVMQALRTLAVERAAQRLLGAVLPRPWALLGRVVAGVALLPRGTRRYLTALVLHVLSRLLAPGVPQPESGTASGRATATPTAGPSAPYAPPAPAGEYPSEAQWARLREPVQDQLDLLDTALPARPARNIAKKRNGPRR